VPYEPYQERRYKEFLAEAKATPETKASSLPRRPSSYGVPFTDYVNSHSKDFSDLRAMEPLEGWTFKKSDQGVDIYTRMAPGSELLSFKAIAEIELPSGGLPFVLQCLLKIEDRPQWDKMCLEAGALENYAPFYRVTYVRMESPAFFIAQRELCMLGRISFEDDGGVMLCLESMDHPDMDARAVSGTVRAILTRGGYIFRPIKGTNKVKAIYTGTVDPKGMIPLWVANLVAWKQGLSLAIFKEYIAKNSR